MKQALAILALCAVSFAQGTTIGGTTFPGGTSNLQGAGQVTVSSILVTPNTAGQSQNVGQTLGFTATATFSNGSTQNVTAAATWTTSNAGIASLASLTATENVLCNSSGTAQISASYVLTSQATLTCNGVLPPSPSLVSIAVTPTSPSVLVGQSVGMTATGTYSDGSQKDVTALIDGVSGWSSATPANATLGALSTTKTVNCIHGGTSVIKAQADSGINGTTTITCNAVLSTISVTPTSPSIVAGTTQQFIATCNYSDGSSLACAAPTWASTNTAAATINSSGLASGLASGTPTISATIGIVAGTTVLTVTNPGPPPPTQTSTTVNPVNKTINKSTTLQYAATAVFSDGSTQSCPSATWVSTSPSVATIGAATGLATGVANGSTTIQGTCNSILGSTTLTVQTPAPTLSSIAVTPVNPAQYNGSSVQFSATGTYSDGSTQNLTSQVAWTSGTPGVAPIGLSSGIAICISNSGSTVITATLGVSGTSTLTCQAASTNTGENAYCTTGGTWIGATVDGPSALPTACMNTALSNTPSPGTTRGPDSTTATVQADINAAACGDVILVTAGSTLGTITLPGKGCDNAHWITIKSTGVSNGLFPPEGTRATPCISGIASMPGRPSYPCPTPTVLSFAIVAPTSASSMLSSHADHYRIIGAEITRTPAPKAIIFQLVDLSSSGTQTNNITFDRCWFHGVDATFPQTAATDTSTTRAVYLAQSNHIAVINSTMSNFYTNGNIASNGNTDAQCITGGIGGAPNTGWGVYKIVNNHCEASSEGILMGGGNGPALTPPGCTILVNCNPDTPSDIEIRGNYFFKPLQWNGNTTVPASTGWPVVKNGFEMKTAIRLLAEGNVMENCWYSAQVCYTFSIAPINQQSGGTPSVPTCPTCTIRDVTYRFNYGYNMAYGIAVYAFIPGGCSGCSSQGGNRISIHDNLIGDNLNLGNLTAQSAGDAMELLTVNDPSGLGLNRIQNLVISHNTFVKAIRSMVLFGDATTSSQFNNLVMHNNIWPYGNFGWVIVGATGGCGTTNNGNPYAMLNACANPYTFDHDAVFNWAGGATLGARWPTNGSGLGNTFFLGSGGVGFTNYNAGNSNFNPANYQLTTGSPLHNAGSDGKDLGADIQTLLGKIAGVRQ